MGDTHYVRHFLQNCVLGMGLNPIRDSTTIKSFPIPDAQNEYGVTGIIILTESHLAFHSWPEHGYLRVELSSCAPVDQERFEEILKAFFVPYRLEIGYHPWFSTKKSTKDFVIT